MTTEGHIAALERRHQELDRMIQTESHVLWTEYQTALAAGACTSAGELPPVRCARKARAAYPPYRRPDGSVTAKVESDDLAVLQGHQRRRTIAALAAAAPQEDGDA